MPANEVLATLDTTLSGLTAQEAAIRTYEYGRNVLPVKEAMPFVLIFVRQLASPLVYILLVAAFVSVIIGNTKDALFIAAILSIDALIGAYQEFQAEKSSNALRKLLRTHAQVERQGEICEIVAEDLVPGDIVWMEPGNRVAADIRLLSTQGMMIDESLLTGESGSVGKNAEWWGNAETVMADQLNMAFAGSMISRGRGKGVVVATGVRTEVGQLSLDTQERVGGKPPLVARMERFTNQVAFGTIGASILIGGFGITLWRHSLSDTFFFMIALAVSAIPEGLPVAITVALAVATSRMARRNVIVRRLTAVEGLGSCTLIVTDKTGTLTCNELTVREVRLIDGTVFEVTGEGFSPKGKVLLNSQPIDLCKEQKLQQLIQSAVLCNEAGLHHRNGSWVWNGDAVDIAILSLGEKLGYPTREDLLDQFPQVNQIPFEPEHQFAATFHHKDNATKIFVKGAPERVLEMCSLEASNASRQKLESNFLSMAKRGLRVIAIASGNIQDSITSKDVPSRPCNLKMLGFIGMIDPLRAGVREAMVACEAAGVKVTIVTGDHRETALAIARELSLVKCENEVMTSSEISEISAEKLSRLTNRVRVFARVTPRQKLDIVNAACRAGHFVAVTGDGVNDAPALRAANVGVAMGKSGTEVAKEAAELVISDDNFASIVAGIEEGRIAYDNIRKVIYLLFSTGAGELLMVLLAVVFGLPLPLLAVQILWLNLVTNGIQDVALAFEPGEVDCLRRQPRPPNESVFNRLMIERVCVAAAVIGVGGFIVFATAIKIGWPVEQARNLLLLTMVLFEIVHIGNCRSETQSAFKRSPLLNPVLFFGSLVAFLFHVAAMYIPSLQKVIHAEPVEIDTWGVAIAVSLLILPAIEIHKGWWNRRSLLKVLPNKQGLLA